MRSLNIFPYFGGKTLFAKQILDHISEDLHLVDLMCGSAAIAINAKNRFKTINDINSDVINFFEVLARSPDQLIKRLAFIPFSKYYFDLAITLLKDPDPIVRAAAFYVRATQSFGAIGSQNSQACWGGQIRLSGHKKGHYRVHTWNTKYDSLIRAAELLRYIQIDSRDVFEAIERYAVQRNILYLDPPYHLSTRNFKRRYRFDFENSDHIRLSESLNSKSSNCQIIISGYNNAAYKELYKNWNMVAFKASRNTTNKSQRTECIWKNF
jgi:DNA adenine methylase